MKNFLKKLYNYGNYCTLGLGKELILGLIIVFVGLVGFSNGLTVPLASYPGGFNQRTPQNWQGTMSKQSFGDTDGFACVYVDYYYSSDYTNDPCILNDGETTYQLSDLQVYCSDNDTFVLTCNITVETVYYTFFKNSFTRLFDPNYTSEQCQSEYSLMPIDSCNSEYCELNGLCETIGGSGSSTLYINDVRHESAPFIYVNIPEEFKRGYLTGEQEFTINVEGLNGDQDYINGIIDVNSYRPSSEDFTQTFVGGLTLIFPYIIITAVILFIRRFIRKIFK